jgi:NAD(P)-dependent dehydrogenase (short-subunit alcohol dehydrogenase family)
MSKIWFVTGSSRGLGRSFVTQALEAGDSVVATARRPEQLNDLVKQYGKKIHAVALDVTDPAAAVAAVEEAVQAFGRIDVVINNAGYGDLAAFEDMSEDMFKGQIDTNFYGVVNVTRAVLPVLRKQGSGHIFQVSSIGGRTGALGLSGYQSAKWAVGGFSTVVAQEVAPFGIKLTILEPGGMATDWAGSSMTIPKVSAPYKPVIEPFAQMLRNSAGKEATRVEDVVPIVRQLVADGKAPLHLLIGSDAVALAENHAKELAENDARWRAVSISASRTGHSSEAIREASKGRS